MNALLRPASLRFANPLPKGWLDVHRASPDVLKAIGWALVACGILARLLDFLFRTPFWHDESWLAENLLTRGPLGLTHTLDNRQVAPIFFLWGEWSLCRLFGYSEYVLRLIPLLAGIASLFVFWRIAWRTLPPRAALVAIALLALSKWPVELSGQAKPYTLDLLGSLLVIGWTIDFVRERRRRSLAWLCAAIVPLMASSFPLVFVAAGASLAMLPVVWREREWRTWSLFALFNLLLVASFACCHLWLGQRMLGDELNSYMQGYWARGFPPGEVWQWPLWLLKIHTSWLVAYPYGNSAYVNVLTFAFVVGGAIAWWKLGRPRLLLLLLLAPFALNLAAAMMHRYPYGGCCRLSQHLAPAVCLLAGLGIVAAIDRFRDRETYHFRLNRGLLALLLIGGIATVAKPFFQSPRPMDLWARNTADDLLRDRPATLILVTPPEQFDHVLRWYLQSRGVSIEPLAKANLDDLSSRKPDMIALHAGPLADTSPPAWMLELHGKDSKLQVVACYTYLPANPAHTADIRTLVVYRKAAE